MTAITSSGLWPAGQQVIFNKAVVYQPLTPRLAVNTTLYSGSGKTTGTQFPVIPQYTKYPVAP